MAAERVPVVPGGAIAARAGRDVPADHALGNVFYTTADGGKTWRPVRQGTHFTQLGAAIDFASPRTGFAWTTGGDATSGSAPEMYVTANSGRTWTAFAPRLAG